MNEITWHLSEDHWDHEDYDLYSLLDHYGKNATRLYMLVLYGLIRSNGWKTLVELGGFRGTTTAILARAAEKNDGVVHVYEMDSWSAAAIKDRFTANSRVYVHHTPSQQAVSLSTPPDFIFVDGDHTYEGCAGDIARWAPQLIPGGCMAFHDVADPEVARAVRDTLPADFTTILFPGDCGLLLARRIE